MSSCAKILIVDDDKDLVVALRVALESKGYRVAAAYDLPAGLQAAAAERPDCIVLDIMMPHATEGFHFVWRLPLNVLHIAAYVSLGLVFR